LQQRDLQHLAPEAPPRSLSRAQAPCPQPAASAEPGALLAGAAGVPAPQRPPASAPSLLHAGSSADPHQLQLTSVAFCPQNWGQKQLEGPLPKAHQKEKNDTSK